MAKFKDTFELVDKVSKPLLKMSRKFAELDKSIGKSQKRLERFQKQTENIAKLGNKIKSVGQGMTVGLTLPIVAAGGAMVKAASDYEESLNKIDVAFGRSSQKIKDWSKNSLAAMGMSKGEALDSAALYGSIATGMGITQEKAAEMAMTLTKRGADLSSFMNVRGDVAQTALKGIFTGEGESLKNLGVTMTEATLQSYAYSKGIRKKINKMSEIEKVMLRYDFVLNRTRMSEDDFIRTGGGAANQMRIFQSTLKDLGETFGQYILPTFTSALKKINEMLQAFGQLPEPVKKGILIFGAVLAIIGPLVTIVGTLITAFAGLNVVLGFLAANPIVLTIAAIIAAIVGVIAIIKNWGKIVKWVKGVWQSFTNWLGSAIQKMGQWLDGLLEKLGWLAYLIPGLGQIKLGKDVAGAISKKMNESKNKTGNNNSINNSNNTTTTNITNNNYSAGANPKNAKYTK